MGGQCDGKGDNISDGSEFSERPFTWISASMTKMKLQGTTMKKLQVNINGIKNGKSKDYLGFMIFPKSLCGKDFIAKVMDGTVGFDFMDKFHNKNDPAGYYDSEAGFNTIMNNNPSPFNGNTLPKQLHNQLSVILQKISFIFWFLDLTKLNLEIRL